MEKFSVLLPSDLAAVVRAAVDSGEYSCTSEVIHAALYDWKFKRKVEALKLDELRHLVREGIESGASVDADLVFSHLRAKYAAISNEDAE
jgi:antitoxin ParD1/3/4